MFLTETPSRIPCSEFRHCSHVGAPSENAHQCGKSLLKSRLFIGWLRATAITGKAPAFPEKCAKSKQEDRDEQQEPTFHGDRRDHHELFSSADESGID